MGSSDFGTTAGTTGYSTVDFNRDEVRAEVGPEYNPGPNWDQSPDLSTSQEIIFNGGERILMNGENMSQYQNQMGVSNATNCYDQNYGSEPQLGPFSPNFQNLPQFSVYHDGIPMGPQQMMGWHPNDPSCFYPMEIPATPQNSPVKLPQDFGNMPSHPGLQMTPEMNDKEGQKGHQLFLPPPPPPEFQQLIIKMEPDSDMSYFQGGMIPPDHPIQHFAHLDPNMLRQLGSHQLPILHYISKYTLTSATTGINFYFKILGRIFKARRDSFSKDKQMMYLRCNTCPKEPCKWRAKIRLNRPDIKIANPAYVNIENYTVLVNSKAHHHHFSCQSYAKTHAPFDEPRENW